MQEKILDEELEQDEVIRVVMDDEQSADSELKRHNQDLLDNLMRTKADFDNYKKRTMALGKTAREEGQKEVITKLLPAVDAFSKAKEVIKDASILEGVELIYNLIADVLNQFNVEKIDAVGAEFNPNVHEAVYMCEDEKNSGKVIDVVQQGYTFNGSLLRAAKVIVAK